VQKEFILGFGGGYSLSLDTSMESWELDWAPTRMYFKEHMKLKHCFNLNAQYFFNKELGLQLEFNHQKGSYFSHLEWYGIWDGDVYIQINHIEEPYRTPWSISSFTLSLLVAKRRYWTQGIFPYAFVGIGFYVLSGNQELVLNRFRLGPKRTGDLLKLGGGIKFNINRSLRLNLRIYAKSIRRKGIFPQSSLYAGTSQFDYLSYFTEEKIIRIPDALVDSVTYFGLDINLELRLSKAKK